LLFAVLAFAIFIGIARGSVDIPVARLILKENRPILYMRILRVFLGIMVGSGLASSGVALQAILRNPLAEPYLLGTSSGAGLGAVIAIMTGLGGVYLPFFAFIGAVLSIIIVYAIAKSGNSIPVQSLILAGVIISVALSAIIVFLVSMSRSNAIHGLMWWFWGSLEVYDIKLLFVAACIVLPGILAIFFFSQDLNAISLGEEEAMHLGIGVEGVKRMIFCLTSLITASLVCVTGVIGFVGLIIPHITRFVVGPNHKMLVPASCVTGAVFLVFCDLLSRTLISPSEIPIGVITTAIGAPVFIFLLKIKQRIR
jgi:iron complex transport system permease protein